MTDVRYGDNWTEHSLGLCEGGHVGGGIQDGESWNRRFICQPQPGEFHVLDFYVYRATEEREDTSSRQSPWVQCQVMYTVCTDPDNVGTTETHADIRYWDGRFEPDEDPKEACASLTREDLSEATSQMGV